MDDCVAQVRFLERKRKNTAGAEQQRQKDTSGKSGYVKPAHPCTGLTTRFANSKTWLLCRTTAILGGILFFMVMRKQNTAVRRKRNMPHYRGEERRSSTGALPVRQLRKDGNAHGGADEVGDADNL